MDSESAEKVKNLILDYNKKYNSTFIVSSHHVDEINDLCSEVYKIEKGFLTKVR